MAAISLRVTVIDPALDPEAPVWGDAAGGWQPAGVAWMSLLAAAGVPVGGDGGLAIVANPDATPDAADRARREGRAVLIGPPPDDPVEALAAVRDALGALVRPDLRGVLVLRLDDPGSSMKRHLAGWAHDDVTAAAWEALWRALDGFGRASIFCCPAWVDADGRTRPSRQANPDEWAAIDRGVGWGLADLECHGYTHVDPDVGAWTAAPDRFTSEDWYRELRPPRLDHEPSVAQQARLLAQWRAACGPGTTLVAPGEAWGLNTLAAAGGNGFELFNSWSVCRLRQPGPVPLFVTGVESPYLDQADPRWLANGLPAVGYWHDRDMAVHGPGWVPEQLAAWRDCGATRAWAFADLARAWATPIDAALVDGQVTVRRAPPVPLLIEPA